MNTFQENKKSGFGKTESNGFNQILFRYLPYWPLFLILIVVAATCAWLYLRYTTPIYESTATILIKDEKKGMDNSELVESLNPFGSKKIVENEIEVIRSRSLASEVVKKLHLYAPITQEGNIVSRSGYIYSPVHIELKNPDSLFPVARVDFSYDKNTSQVKIGKMSYPMNQWVKTDFGELRFIPNPHFQPSSDSKMYFSLYPVKGMANAIRNRLTVFPTGKQSTVLSLKLRDDVPARAEDIINELIAAYNKAAISDKNALAANTLAFVEERLHFVVRELDSVESRIQQYKTQKGIVDISEQGKQLLATVGTSDQQVSEINVQLAVLDQVEDYVQGKSGKTGIVPSTLGVNDQVLSQLLDKLYAAEIEYERLRKTVAENNPILASLRDQINSIKPSIEENIRNQRRNLEASRRNIASSTTTYSSMLRTIPQKERELLEISRQQSIKNNIYTFLLQKREETALSYGSTVPDSRVVDHADTTWSPVSPKANMIYIQAIIVALILGVGIVTLKEVLNRNILFRSEIENLTSFPIIGEVAFDSETKSNIVIAEGKRDFVAEQFRQLRTSLGYLGINTKRKKILVTSTISGEGKSFISANLGVSLALTGKKVVLIELDLRKPKLSESFNISREVGISNYFIGDKESDEIIKRTEANENLFIIPAGPIPPNPSELILNGRMEELLSYLDTIFDYIIIDTAPVSPVTDAYILSPMCDATLYIIRHGYTPKTYVQMLDENNKVRSLKNVAIVFNGVRARGLGKFDYGYGYGYGNGYGYGYEEKKGKKKKKIAI